MLHLYAAMWIASTGGTPGEDRKVSKVRLSRCLSLMCPWVLASFCEYFLVTYLQSTGRQALSPGRQSDQHFSHTPLPEPHTGPALLAGVQGEVRRRGKSERWRKRGDEGHKPSSHPDHSQPRSKSPTQENGLLHGQHAWSWWKQRKLPH